VVVVVLFVAGCGGAKRGDAAAAPRAVPPGSVAIVGAVPITTPGLRVSRQAVVQRTISFLVRAQWLLQESDAEGASESAVDRLASQQAGRTQHSGMTHGDAVFQARLSVLTEGLQSRHSTAAPATQAQVAAYYAAHRSQFRNPAVRHTLMVVTHDRATALAARTALASGQPWSAVAKRWSVDSSKLTGARYAVVEGVQSPALVHAAFAAKPGRITGPVSATPAAQAGGDYYVFKVTGGQPGSPQPLTQAAAQISRTLGERERERALAVFTSVYEQRWRNRTLCAPGYVIAECRNQTTTREHEP
jgi:hypothetical protein